MLDSETKRRIDGCRDILVGKVPDPKSQVEQITIALIYKFMDDMDAEAEELGGKRSFFTGDYARFGWARVMAPNLGGFEVLALYSEAIQKMNENPGVPVAGLHGPGDGRDRRARGVTQSAAGGVLQDRGLYVQPKRDRTAVTLPPLAWRLPTQWLLGQCRCLHRGARPRCAGALAEVLRSPILCHG